MTPTYWVCHPGASCRYVFTTWGECLHWHKTHQRSLCPLLWIKMQRYPKFLVESSGKLVGWNQSQESEELFGTELDTHTHKLAHAHTHTHTQHETLSYTTLLPTVFTQNSLTTPLSHTQPFAHTTLSHTTLSHFNMFTQTSTHNPVTHTHRSFTQSFFQHLFFVSCPSHPTFTSVLTCLNYFELSWHVGSSGPSIWIVVFWHGRICACECFPNQCVIAAAIAVHFSR